MPYKLSNRNCISTYLHCGECLKEIPDGVAPRDYQRIQTGFTEHGIQVWCTRHNLNVIHIDFEGREHPANTTAYMHQWKLRR